MMMIVVDDDDCVVCFLSDIRLCVFCLVNLICDFPSVCHWSLICSSSVRSLLFLCSKFALPLFAHLWLSLCPLNPFNNSLTSQLPYSIFSTFGIWGKQDGTSNCAWGWRGQICSSPALGSPQPPPGCHYFSLSSLSLPLLTNNNIS